MNTYFSFVKISVFLLCIFNFSFAQNASNQLLGAIREDNVKEVQKLMATGIDVNKPSDIGITPLIQAAWSKNINMVKLLVNGADVNLNTPQFSSALFAASSFGNIETANISLKKGLISMPRIKKEKLL